MTLPVAVQCWELRSVGEPLVRAERSIDEVPPGRVVVRVAGCGVCHTDLGYALDGVRPRHELPLTLGHEIAGVVEHAEGAHADLVGKSVLVPAVIPCGDCALCASGHGMICRAQIFPGCDVHGGFASHVVVPANGLCLVDPDKLEASPVDLPDLAVLGDAVSTAYQATVKADLAEGDFAIIVGAGGVGSFLAQIAAAKGAHVVALDVDEQRLRRAAEYGANHTVTLGDLDPRAVRKQLRGYAKEHALPETCWKIFECSGNAKGQELAYSLLTFGAVLAVVGYTLDTVTVRLSNLMAFDARAQGVWGCLPEHYPAVLDLVLSGRVQVMPFIERRPMSEINAVFTALSKHELTNRPVLVPDFE